MADQGTSQSTDYAGQMIMFGVKRTCPDFSCPLSPSGECFAATPLLRPANATLQVCDVGERLLEAAPHNAVFAEWLGVLENALGQVFAGLYSCLFHNGNGYGIAFSHLSSIYRHLPHP